MNLNIKKPYCRSRLWRATRRKRNPLPSVRETHPFPRSKYAPHIGKKQLARLAA